MGALLENAKNSV